MNNLTDINEITFSQIQEMNIFRFHLAKSKREAYTINELFRDSKSFSDFKRKLYDMYSDIDKDKLSEEYSYAVNSCSSGLEYLRLIKKKELFPFWRINLIKDREYPKDIYLLDDLILPATSELWNYIFPPNFLGDISNISARMKHEVDKIDHVLMNDRVHKFLNTELWKTCSENGFGINRAVKSLVLEENEKYLRSLDD